MFVKAKISIKNEVIIPKVFRKKYGIRPGDKVRISQIVEDGETKLVIEKGEMQLFVKKA